MTSGKVVLERYAEEIGHGTNNYAEYRALLKGLEMCSLAGHKKVVCYSDSEIMMNQIYGSYKVRDPKLRPLREKILKQAAAFSIVKYRNVRRTNLGIKHADILLNQAITE